MSADEVQKAQADLAQTIRERAESSTYQARAKFSEDLFEMVRASGVKLHEDFGAGNSALSGMQIQQVLRHIAAIQSRATVEKESRRIMHAIVKGAAS